MAEDKYFGIAPENEADAEKQRAKQKRRKAMIENMLKDEEDGYDEFDAVLEAIKRIERNLEIIKGCLWTSRYMDDDDDRPYGYDGPMPWDEDGEDEKGDDVMETLSDHLDKSINELFSAIVRLENDLQQMEVQKDDDAPTKDDCGECALLFPIPCTKNMPQVTVKDWFAKLDEEVNEWKEAVLRVETLHTPVAKLKDIGRADKARIAEEGADVSTVVASMEDLMDIDGEARADAQLHVSQHNKERGRW
ncbi:MAG: hypothetical protein PUE51_06340 [Veillonellaceae bacterium]|nr:hypothetical protein [Veillonellaceae bacterium]